MTETATPITPDNQEPGPGPDEDEQRFEDEGGAPAPNPGLEAPGGESVEGAESPDQDEIDHQRFDGESPAAPGEEPEARPPEQPGQ